MEPALWKTLATSPHPCMLDLANVSLSEYDAVICSSFSRIVSPCCSTTLSSEAPFTPLALRSACTAANSSGVYFFEAINSRLKAPRDPRTMYGVSPTYRRFPVFGGGPVTLAFLSFLFNPRRLYTLA